MEWMGIVLFIIFVNVMAGAFKKARKQERGQSTRRTPGYSPRPRVPVAPRRQLEDVLNQVMGQVGIEDVGKGPIAQSSFAGEGMSMSPRVAPSYAPPGGYAEGEGHQDALGRVGGSMVYDSPEGTEFHGYIHKNVAPDYELLHAPEPTAVHARLTSRQALGALIMAEVLDKPVSMRKGGLRR